MLSRPVRPAQVGRRAGPRKHATLSRGISPPNVVRRRDLRRPESPAKIVRGRPAKRIGRVRRYHKRLQPKGEISMSATQEVFAFLKDLVLNVTDVEEGQVTPDAPVAELGLESMDLVELQLTVRKKFAVEVPARAFADGQLTT